MEMLIMLLIPALTGQWLASLGAEVVTGIIYKQFLVVYMNWFFSSNSSNSVWVNICILSV